MKLLSGSASQNAHGAPAKGYSRFLLRVGFVLLMVGLIVFSVYQLVTHIAVGLDTLRTQEITEESYVNLELYIFRDEEVLAPTGDLYGYHVSNGERVGVGDILATAYTATQDTVGIQPLLNLYAERLSALKKGQGQYTPESLASINRALDQAYLALLAASDEGNADNSGDAALRLKEGLRQYEALVSGSDKETDAKAELETAMQALLNGCTQNGQKITDRSGYFYYDTDGYELLYNVDEVMTMTPEAFLALTETPAQTYQGAVTGKMVYSATWYAAAYVSLADVAETAFTVGTSYTMICSDSMSTEIPMTVVRMEPTADGAFLVFEANAMPDGFAFERRISAQTVTGRTSGYRIPAEAFVTLTDDEGKDVTGVYILAGNVVEFRKVHIKVARDGYTVVATYGEVTAMLDALPEEEKEKLTADGWSYLNLNDKIITRGTGLYEGKIIS